MEPIKVAFIGSRILPTIATLLSEFGNRFKIDLDLLLCSNTREALLDSTEIHCPSVRTRIHKGISLPVYSEPGVTYDINPGVLYDLVFNRYDLFILGGYYLFSTQAAFVLGIALSTPYVLFSETHAHGRSAGGVLGGIKRTIVKQVVRSAASYIAISTWARDYLLSYGANPHAIFVIPYLPAGPQSVMLSSKDEKALLRKQYGLAEDTDIVLWAGRMIGRKRLDVLLKAVNMLEQAHDMQVVIVGSGPEESRLRNIQKEMKIPNVHFVGPKSQHVLRDFYRMADVFVYPSSDEPFGAVIPEAMAHGLPIITTNVVGSSADFVIHERNGFVIPANDVPALASTLTKILENNSLREQMAHVSLEIMSDHSIEKNAETFMRALDYAHNKKGRRW